MKDLRLDADGDLDVTNANPVVVDQEYVRQKIQIRLRMFKGEWFLDTRVGMPYFQTIFKDKFNKSSIESIYRAAIVTVPGVLEILPGLSISLSSARELSVTFSVKTVDGVIDFNEAFVLTEV